MIAELAPAGPLRAASMVGSRLRSPSVLGPLSQGVTSLSNLVMMLAVAGALPAREFGLFALVQTVGLVVEGVLRAAFGETMAVADSGTAPRRAGIVDMALLPAAAMAAVAVPAALVVGAGRLELLCVALALGLVPRVLADTLRHVAFAARTPAVAVVIDVVWLAVQLVAMAVAVPFGLQRATAAVMAWGVGAAAASLVGLRALHIDPSVGSWRDGWAWLVVNRRLSWAYTVEFLVLSASTQAVLIPVALLSNSETVAALRGAQLAFGLVTTLTLGLRSALTPHAVALVQRGRSAALDRLAVGTSAGAVAVGLFVTVCLWVLPDGPGRSLFGETWPLVAAVAVPFGVARAIFSGSIGPLIVLRARALTRAGVRLRTLTAVLWSSAMLVGAAIGGARLASWLSVGAATAALALYALAAAAAPRQTRRPLSAEWCP